MGYSISRLMVLQRAPLCCGRLFMESFHFKSEMLSTAVLKPKFYKRFVDDILLIWKHGHGALIDLVSFLNSRYEQIRFTVELEKDGWLPFLDMSLIMCEGGMLGRTVYWKLTHTKLYTNSHSHHHPAQKSSLMQTLLHRAKGIADTEHLTEELATLENEVLRNGFLINLK